MGQQWSVSGSCDNDGTVAVHKDAAAGTYTVTAVSQFDKSKQAYSEITVDNSEHIVNIVRENTTNSPDAEIEVYRSKEDAEGTSGTYLVELVKEQRIPQSHSGLGRVWGISEI